MRSTRWVAAGLVGLVAAVALAPPAGADVIRQEPIGGPDLAIIPTRVNDAGYVSFIGFSGYGSAAAYGPEIGLVFADRFDLPPGFTGIPEITAVNDDGVAAGSVSAGLTSSAYVADLHGTDMTLLSSGGFEHGRVTDIVGSTTVVGFAYSGSAVVTSAHGTAWVGPDHELRVVPDFGFGSVVTDVNEAGLAVGWMIDGAGLVHPFSWDLAAGAGPVDLSPVTGPMVMTRTVHVNERGDILVELGRAFEDGSATSWGHDVVVEHGTNRLVEPYPVGEGGGAILNDVGQVAYAVEPPPGEPRQYYEILDIATGATTVVPAPGEFLFTFNSLGQIGTTRRDDPGSPDVAVLWDPVRGWGDIGDLDGRGASVWAMSDTGYVAGTYGTGLTSWVGSVRFGPQPPTDVRGEVVGTAVTLRWSPPTSVGDAPLDAYRVLRDGVEVGQVDGATTTFAEPVPAPPGTSLTYEVVAVNAYGESAPSQRATVVVPVPAPAPNPSSPAPAPPATAVVARPTLAG